MNKHLKKLTRQLQEFGLNPKEWTLQTSSHASPLQNVKLRSRQDAELILEGQANARGWVSLSVQG